MANPAVVGILRTLLTADTAEYQDGMRKAVTATATTTKAIDGLGKQVSALTPQAERMVKAFGGDKLLYSANSLAAAITKIGGATKLTTAEQARANATLTAAIDKYKVLGIQAPKAILDAEKATSTLSGKISGLVGGLGPLGPSILAAFSATAVIGFVKAVADAADSLVKLHDKTQISLQGLQRFQIAGDDAGNSLEELTGAITQMQNRLGNAKPGDAFDQALRKIGLTIGELQAMNPEGQFMAISDGLRTIEDPALRVSTAVALGGRQMAAVLPTLARGFDDLRGRTVGMSDDTIRALDEAGDAWKKLERISLDVIGTIAAHSIDALFPIRSAVRQEQALLDQLKSQVEAAQGRIPGLIGPKPLDVPTLSMQEADRIAKELDEKTQELIKHELELARAMAQAFGLDKVASARQLLEAIGGVAGLVHMDADALKSLNKLMDDAIGAAKRNGQDVPLEWFRILEATRDNVGSLQDYLKTVQQLPEAFAKIPEPPELIPFKSELDQERIRNLLAVNIPGSGPRRAAAAAGATLGQEMASGLGRAFEQVPHFLISSVLHSGGFLNGLKAIGVQMADAIVEPLIKQFALKLAGARLASGLASAVGLGVGAAAIGSSAATAGTVGAATAATGGTAAAGGAGLGGSLAALATNPITIGVAAGIAGILLFRHFKGGNGNDNRDKFLTQFAGFDTKHDNNPPGFYGLDALLTKYRRHDLFTALIAAHSTSDVKRAEMPIAAFMATLGRSVKTFNFGGFVPPGVVQPAILHGGMYGEDIVPRGSSSHAVTVNQYITIQGVLDRASAGEVFRAHILPLHKRALMQNTDGLTGATARALDR